MGGCQGRAGSLDGIRRPPQVIAGMTGMEAVRTDHRQGEVTRQLVKAGGQVAQNSAATTQMSASIQEVNHTATDLALASEQLRDAIGNYKV